MGCANSFYIGADTTITVQCLDKNGDIFVIASSSTVSGALVDPRLDQLKSAVKVILEADPENDWPNGIVAFQLTDEETAVLRAGVYGVEIKSVDDKVYRLKIPYAVEAIDTSIP